jgi:hypothetical protein
VKKTWQGQWKFDLDAAAGETHQETIWLDGHEYEMIVAPADRLRTARRRVLKEGVGGIEKEGISLGPRGGGCPCCGK